MSDTLKIAIAGLGTVGASTIKLLQAEPTHGGSGRNIEVVAVSARNRSRDRGVDLSGISWVDDPVDLAKTEADVFVELIGGAGGAALAAVEAALTSGKAVVTANKALLAEHGMRLVAMAEASGVPLLYEAAVAGAIPAIRTVRDGLAGVPISSVLGIMNGTCNYILTRMETDGIGFDECLADAQRLGYAEADPTFDVDGFDTAHKLAILASIAFTTEIDAEAMNVEGIRNIEAADIAAAAELGFRIKLLGIATMTEDGVDQRVHPTMVPRGTALAETSGVTNAVSVRGPAFNELVLSGPGAGGMATASAVVSDLTDLARGLAPRPLGRPAASLLPFQKPKAGGHRGAFYVRLPIADRAGAFASLAKNMAAEGISLEQIVQKTPHRPEHLPPLSEQTVILVTYPTDEAALMRALAAIEAEGIVVRKPHVIRIAQTL
ncbi:homoserine dehydrogenase [Acuticoccus yangtzensis]|uniref:homoserine dehydrogenase n=1 Tax=Acuticoccus yangtzensis TaxID=1443441 RepID=UPI0009499EF1|nr:homoserine dehydrogenase [Acuticoccus yangtzensis]